MSHPKADVLVLYDTDLSSVITQENILTVFQDYTWSQSPINCTWTLTFMNLKLHKVLGSFIVSLLLHLNRMFHPPSCFHFFHSSPTALQLYEGHPASHIYAYIVNLVCFSYISHLHISISGLLFEAPLNYLASYQILSVPTFPFYMIHSVWVYNLHLFISLIYSDMFLFLSPQNTVL